MHPSEKWSKMISKDHWRIYAHIFLRIRAHTSSVRDWKEKRRGSSCPSSCQLISVTVCENDISLSLADISASLSLFSFFPPLSASRSFTPIVKVVSFDVSGPLRLDRDCVIPIASRYYPSSGSADQAAKRRLSLRDWYQCAISFDLFAGVCQRMHFVRRKLPSWSCM